MITNNRQLSAKRILLGRASREQQASAAHDFDLYIEALRLKREELLKELVGPEQVKYFDEQDKRMVEITCNDLLACSRALELFLAHRVRVQSTVGQIDQAGRLAIGKILEQDFPGNSIARAVLAANPEGLL